MTKIQLGTKYNQRMEIKVYLVKFKTKKEWMSFFRAENYCLVAEDTNSRMKFLDLVPSTWKKLLTGQALVSSPVTGYAGSSSSTWPSSTVSAEVVPSLLRRACQEKWSQMVRMQVQVERTKEAGAGVESKKRSEKRTGLLHSSAEQDSGGPVSLVSCKQKKSSHGRVVRMDSRTLPPLS